MVDFAKELASRALLYDGHLPSFGGREEYETREIRMAVLTPGAE